MPRAGLPNIRSEFLEPICATNAIADPTLTIDVSIVIPVFDEKDRLPSSLSSVVQ